MSTWPRKKRLRLVPFSRMISARSTKRASLISSAPPSPQMMFLVSWKLSAAEAPERAERPALVGGERRPARRPRSPAARAVRRCARRRPSRRRRRRSAPARSARVRGVIAASTSVSSRLSVSGRMSTNTGTRAAQHEGVGRRDEGERGHDDLVARLRCRPAARHLQGRGARMRQQTPGAADAALEMRVAPLGEGAVAGQLAVGMGLGDVSELAAGHERAVEGFHRRSFVSRARPARSTPPATRSAAGGASGCCRREGR